MPTRRQSPSKCMGKVGENRCRHNPAVVPAMAAPDLRGQRSAATGAVGAARTSRFKDGVRRRQLRVAFFKTVYRVDHIRRTASARAVSTWYVGSSARFVGRSAAGSLRRHWEWGRNRLNRCVQTWHNRTGFLERRRRSPRLPASTLSAAPGPHSGSIFCVV